MRCRGCHWAHDGRGDHVCDEPLTCGCRKSTCLVRKRDVPALAPPAGSLDSPMRPGETCHCDGPPHSYDPAWCGNGRRK